MNLLLGQFYRLRVFVEITKYCWSSLPLLFTEIEPTALLFNYVELDSLVNYLANKVNSHSLTGVVHVVFSGFVSLAQLVLLNERFDLPANWSFENLITNIQVSLDLVGVCVGRGQFHNLRRGE